ncbi:MAG: imidazole glycerol phosphate synthase subunit HisH [Bacteroidales bacterium]|nr:imidazole glycerol phosphate synthase subunit HisH [Candidatus Physcousia equi]
MKVAIVKYNAGNIYSVINALRRLGVEPILTDDPEELACADKVIFPGQGEASNAMRYLRAHNLDRVITQLRQPLLGICIGQQLLCRHSEEGNTDCLGIFDVDVVKFQPKEQGQKVPHMGWNTLEQLKSDIFKGFEGNEYAYFVHSYYVPLCSWAAATTDYIQPYASALHRDNFYATQFHPEKSGSVGERILKNFLEL